MPLNPSCGTRYILHEEAVANLGENEKERDKVCLVTKKKKVLGGCVWGGGGEGEAKSARLKKGGMNGLVRITRKQIWYDLISAGEDKK